VSVKKKYSKLDPPIHIVINNYKVAKQGFGGVYQEEDIQSERILSYNPENHLSMMESVKILEIKYTRFNSMVRTGKINSYYIRVSKRNKRSLKKVYLKSEILNLLYSFEEGEKE